MSIWIPREPDLFEVKCIDGEYRELDTMDTMDTIKRVAVFLFGLGSYLLFVCTLLYSIFFVGDLVWLFPADIQEFSAKYLVTMNSEPVWRSESHKAVSFNSKLLVDFGLLVIFGLQHSIMARRPFKVFFRAIFPEIIERSTYVLFSSLALIFLYSQWRPLTGQAMIWDWSGQWQGTAMQAMFFVGWGFVVFTTTVVIGRHDPFGIKRVYYHLVRKEFVAPAFSIPQVYRFLRHPVYLGFLLAFWGTPVMSIGHFFYASMITVYLLIAIQLEERDLVRFYGKQYLDYKQKVSMLIPKFGHRN